MSPAAVLVPVVKRSSGLYLVFTLRPEEMPTHGGQISFPGGRHDLKDADLRATALREASEELGVEVGDVEILGQLDDEITPLGFVITPFVGWLGDAAPFRPNPREVARCFELSLTALADPAVFCEHGERVIRGQVFTLPEYRVGEHVIWGATARIVQDFFARVGELR